MKKFKTIRGLIGYSVSNARFNYYDTRLKMLEHKQNKEICKAMNQVLNHITDVNTSGTDKKKELLIAYLDYYSSIQKEIDKRIVNAGNEILGTELRAAGQEQGQELVKSEYKQPKYGVNW